MRVSSTSNVLSYNISSAFNFLADEYSIPQYKTVAWFTNFMSRWFTIMTSRSLFAFSKKNIEKYNEIISFLEQSIEFFSILTIGSDKRWKSFQTSAIISTTSFLQISIYLLNERDFIFVLGFRFIQDCIENTFSILRTKNQIPNLLQFKNNLKLISIAQFTRDINSGNYEEDDRQSLSGFLDILEEKKNSEA